MRAVTREEIREIDRRATEEFGVPAATLMENAGRAVADVVLQEFNPLAVTVVCGKGNNGGDGRVAARHLRDAGVEVHEYTPETGYAEIDWTEVVVDALFGTGLARPVEGEMLALIEEMNGNGPVVAVDIPSGLDADTGKPLGAAVRAAITVTMGMPKVGMLAPEARAYTGRIIVADIGYPRELMR